MLVTHELEPIFDKNSQVLILGSLPSVKSREIGFYYGHKQNRFWKVLADVFNEDLSTIKKRIEFLKKYHIALWDVIAECEIKGSSDSTIKNVKANDLNIILRKAPVKTIFVTGKTAEKLYNKYIFPEFKIPCIYLPSTSPANQVVKYEILKKEYSKIKDVIM